MNHFENIKDIIVKPNHTLKDFCTFRIGGKAKFIITCLTTTSLLKVCSICIIHNIKYKIIGLGANLLFDNKGYDGVIIVNRSSKFRIEDNKLFLDSGISIAKTINLSLQNSLSGLEGFASIPATIGGAVVNNLGINNASISTFVKSVDFYIDSDYKKYGKFIKHTFKNKSCSFSYRNSIFRKNSVIITKVVLELSHCDKKNIQQKITEAIDKKVKSQPLDQFSAGSIFLHSPTLIPAKTIDELQLKGLTIGGAKISEKHAGFIVNFDNASSKDVKKLIVKIQKRIYLRYKEKLNLEIEIVDV